MKRLVVLVVLVTSAGMTLRWMRETRPAWATAIWKQITYPYRVLRLQTSPPDDHLQVPVAGVKRHSIANTWRAPRGADRLHQGQDIFAPAGTPVLSATSGIVVKIGIDRLGGNVVLVLGAGNRSYYYAHLSRYAEDLQVGDEVRPGTLLGYVGTTGNARGTPPHLHFAVYTPGGAMDPLPLLTD